MRKSLEVVKIPSIALLTTGQGQAQQRPRKTWAMPTGGSSQYVTKERFVLNVYMEPTNSFNIKLQ